MGKLFMTQQIVLIPTKDGGDLEGLIRIPKGKGPFPTVLFVAGLGMTMHEWRNSFDEIAKRLVSEGMMTLQFTFDIFKSDGRVFELPLGERAKRVGEVMDWLLTMPNVDKNRIGLLAQSYGVPTAMSANLQRIRSVVLVGGVYTLYDSIVWTYKAHGAKLHFDGETTLPRSSGEHTTVGKEFWVDAKAFDHVAAAAAMTMPSFLIHGDKDRNLTVDEVKKAYQAFASKGKRLKIYKGGDHGINEVPRPMREEFLGDVVQWFTKTL